MNKIANVVFPYSPSNDDELELTVGDKIEVIGIEEEGWWKGNLKGRIGVFPSNFVQVIETEAPTSSTQNINKLNSLLGSRVGSKNSLTSSNSLNNINRNGNSNSSINNNNNSSSNTINNSVSNNNLSMNNTHQQHDNDSANEYPFGSSADDSLHSNNSLGERRPKPIRCVGYGDIFAQGAKLRPQPVEPGAKLSSAMASERLSSASITQGIDASTLGRMSTNTLPKSIPKKPPPPAPSDSNGSNGSTGPDQAPALPPKPSNQFSPFLPQRPPPNPIASQRTVREQVRVLYAYKPTNDDELEMGVGDIIDIIDKNIEDAGWWKGELRGKIGVFPDNFVTPISSNSDCQTLDYNLSSAVHSIDSSGSERTFIPQDQKSNPISIMESKVKPVFAGTPQGFSKELESNLEKHGNSIKKTNNRLPQLPISMGPTIDQSSMPMALNASNSSGVSQSPASMMYPETNQKQNGHQTGANELTSPGKLNHITANRAKGPTRRPPSIITNKRNQMNELHKSDTRIQSIDYNIKDDMPPVSLTALKQTPAPLNNQQTKNHGHLASLPNVEQQKHQSQSQVVTNNVATTPPIGSFTLSSTNTTTSPNLKQAPSAVPSQNNGVSETIVPKTSQRLMATPTSQAPIQSETKAPRINPTSAPTTPPWMIELRKTNAEKNRRDTPTTTTPSSAEDKAPPIASSVPSTPPSVADEAVALQAETKQTLAISTPPVTVPTESPLASVAPKTSAVAQVKAPDIPLKTLPPKLSDESSRQAPKSFANEVEELRNDVKQLREDFKNILSLKNIVETMRVELRICQNATESQRKYIKELVNNLADERKKIAAIQSEIDRNLT